MSRTHVPAAATGLPNFTRRKAFATMASGLAAATAATGAMAALAVAAGALPVPPVTDAAQGDFEALARLLGRAYRDGRLTIGTEGRLGYPAGFVMIDLEGEDLTRFTATMMVGAVLIGYRTEDEARAILAGKGKQRLGEPDAELFRLEREHEKARAVAAKAWKEADESDEEADACGDLTVAADAVAVKIADIPATSLEGIRAKARAWSLMTDDRRYLAGLAPGAEVLISLADDILAGGAA